MKFVNTSGNTIYLADLKRYIPYKEGKYESINVDLAKKSPGFRMMLRSGKIKLVEYGNSLFEKNLLKIQDMAKNINIENVQNSFSDIKSNNMEVKIRGHFYEAGGYAKVNRNLAKGLSDLGVNVNIEVTSKQINNLTETELKSLKKINKPVSRDAIVIDSMIPTFSSMSSGKYRVLYTTVEADSVPDQFIEAAHQYNEVWVASDFCKNVLVKSGVKNPIYVINNSIDTNLYNETSQPYEFNPPLKDFVFISVFGWSYRKGYDALLKTYLEEFTQDDNVSLLIVSRYLCDTSKSDIVKDTIKEYISKYDNAAHIARLSNPIPEEKMPNLYRAANAFCILTRGEGFLLTAAEASLCGLPVIATNFSGHTMFLKENNSCLVDVDDLAPMEVGKMHVHYWDGQIFPRLTSKTFIKNAREKMRDMYDNYDKYLEKNNILKNFLKENYNIEQTAKLVYGRLEKIKEKIK